MPEDLLKHMWVSMQYTPLQVEKGDDGNLSVYASDDALQVSDEEAKMGCWFCHTPLSTETFDTQCPKGKV